jgi:hypothetical protein
VNIWENFEKKAYLKYKISEFQWKSIHNIVYNACRLTRMGLSRGFFHFCKTHLVAQQQRCQILFPVFQYIQTLIFEINNVTFDQYDFRLRKGYRKKGGG